MSHLGPLFKVACSVFFLCPVSSVRFLELDDSCGGFIEVVNPGDTGTIYSPGYPGNYNDLELCIWVIQAPLDYAVQLTIEAVAGETNGTDCIDFLEVRNGSASSSQLYMECVSDTPSTIASNSRWLWVRFYSNLDNTNSGFSASWNTISLPESSGETNQFPECQSQDFLCPNKQCTTWAYRCDGQNDCGCLQGGCDEAACGGFNIGQPTKIAIGVGLGSGVLLFIFFGIGLLDILLKRRADRKYQQRLERQKRLHKQKKAKAMAQLFVQRHSISLSSFSCGDGGTRLDLPSSGNSARSSFSNRGK